MFSFFLEISFFFGFWKTRQISPDVKKYLQQLFFSPKTKRIVINSHVLFNSFIPCIHKISIRFFLELFRFCLNPKAIVMLTVSIISIKVLHIFLFLYNSNFPDSSVGKASACNCRRPGFDFWGGKIPWRRDRLPTPVFLGFPCGSAARICLQCRRPGFDP